jgi:hypothetical protein
VGTRGLRSLRQCAPPPPLAGCDFLSIGRCTPPIPPRGVRLLSLWRCPQILQMARDPATGSTRMACGGGIHKDGVRRRDLRGAGARPLPPARTPSSPSSVHIFISLLPSLSSRSSIFPHRSQRWRPVLLVAACGATGCWWNAAAAGSWWRPGDGMRRPGGGLVVLVVTSTEVRRHSVTAVGQWARAFRLDFSFLFPIFAES